MNPGNLSDQPFSQDDGAVETAAERLQRQAQTRAAKEIAAAHADPDWLNEH